MFKILKNIAVISMLLLTFTNCPKKPKKTDPLGFLILLLSGSSSSSNSCTGLSSVTVTTLAGGDSSGSSDGTGASASFNSPNGIALDSAGNLFVMDTKNYKIRKVTTSGIVTTIAGSGIRGASDGTSALTATFCDNNYFLGFNATQELLIPQGYGGCASGGRIRKIASVATPTATVSTITGLTALSNSLSTDGSTTTATYTSLYGLAISPTGDIYVAESNFSSQSSGEKIRKISGNTVTTIAGGNNFGYKDGNGTTAQFSSPRGLAIDSSGNIFVADSWNYLIRKIAPNGDVTSIGIYPGSSFAGNCKDGIASSAGFSGPNGLAIDSSNNLYLADNYFVRKISPEGTVTTLAGIGNNNTSIDGTGNQARFQGLSGIAVTPNGKTIYVTESRNSKIRQIAVP